MRILIRETGTLSLSLSLFHSDEMLLLNSKKKDEVENGEKIKEKRTYFETFSLRSHFYTVIFFGLVVVVGGMKTNKATGGKCHFANFALKPTRLPPPYYPILCASHRILREGQNVLILEKPKIDG